jgi:hypothetical protein
MRFEFSTLSWFATHFFTWRTVMRFATTLTVALVLVSLGTAQAIADTITLECSADAWGLSGYYNADWNADKNFGTQTDPYGTVMMASWDPANTTTNHKFWVKFDLSSVIKPIASATLRMTRVGGATDGYDAVLVGALKDGDPGESWGETTITYNNAPGNVLNDYTFNWSSNMPYMGALDYPASGGAGDVISLTSDALQQAINDDTNGVLTLGFTKRGYDPGNGAIFASREDSFYAGATLVLTTVPEPSVIMLLWTGLVGLLAYAWRKRK